MSFVYSVIISSIQNSTIHRRQRGIFFITIKWAALCENISSGICGQRRPRSACASALSDQGLHCPLKESLDTTECINGEQMPGSYFAHAQNDANTHILRKLEGRFSAWCSPNFIFYSMDRVMNNNM